MEVENKINQEITEQGAATTQLKEPPDLIILSSDDEACDQLDDIESNLQLGSFDPDPLQMIFPSQGDNCVSGMQNMPVVPHSMADLPAENIEAELAFPVPLQEPSTYLLQPMSSTTTAMLQENIQINNHSWSEGDYQQDPSAIFGTYPVTNATTSWWEKNMEAEEVPKLTSPVVEISSSDDELDIIVDNSDFYKQALKRSRVLMTGMDDNPQGFHQKFPILQESEDVSMPRKSKLLPPDIVQTDIAFEDSNHDLDNLVGMNGLSGFNDEGGDITTMLGLKEETTDSVAKYLAPVLPEPQKPVVPIAPTGSSSSSNIQSCNQNENIEPRPSEEWENYIDFHSEASAPDGEKESKQEDDAITKE